MHVSVDQLLARQHDCLGFWQLRLAGRTASAARAEIRRAGLRPISGVDGVWTSSRGELTDLQRWSAATRSAPKTGLFLADACGLHGLSGVRGHRQPAITVVRPGSGGPRRHGIVEVHRRRRPDLLIIEGIPVLAPTPLVVAMVSCLEDAALRRLVIEALRLRRTTVPRLRRLAARGRGAARLIPLLDDLEALPLVRCRSNAEGQALWRMRQAGRPPPLVNVRIAGHEVDFVDPDSREVLELDGPAFHADTAKDAARDADVGAAGFSVRRRPTDDAYDPTAEW